MPASAYANALLEEGRARMQPPTRKRPCPRAQRYELRWVAPTKRRAIIRRPPRVSQRVFQPAQQFRGRCRRIGIAQAGSLRISGRARTRADLLLKAKHYSDAVHDYAESSKAQPAVVRNATGSGRALEKRRQPRCPQAAELHGSADGDAEAERLYLLSETARPPAMKTPCSAR